MHVLDLSFFLPAVFITGVLLLRRQALGCAGAPGQLTWVALTCLPIVVTPVVAALRGHEAGWAVLLPVGVIFAVSGFLLRRLVSQMLPAPVYQPVR